MNNILTELEAVPGNSPLSGPNQPAPKPDSDWAIEEGTWARLEERVRGLGKHLRRLADCSDDQSRAAECTQFQSAVHALEKCAAANWRQSIIRVAAALEAFLSELQSKPHQINDSRLRTLALAVDVLGTLIQNPESKRDQSQESTAVVVDAEKVSCTAACNALRNAGFNPAKFSEPDLALAHLSSNPVDLVVLDMPAAGESGFDLYKKLRELPMHRDTPVIFVTDFCEMKCPAGTVSESETQFIAKPHNMLSYLELALKALSRVLQFRVTNVAGASVAPSPSSVAPAPQGPSPVDGTSTPNQLSTMKEDSSTNSGQKPNESPAKAAPAPAITRELSKCSPELEKEFADLWQMCEELTRELAAERKSAVEFKRATEERENQGHEKEKGCASESPESERRLRESIAACARATGDLEKERAERRRIEQRAAVLAGQLPELHGQLKQHLESESLNQSRTTQLEQQLREREDTLARVSADLEKEKEERQLAEQQLSATGDLSTHLRDCLASFEAAKLSFKRTQEQIEAQMQASIKATGESEARLQKETAERQRVEEALAAAKRTNQEQAAEFSKLQSAFQVEQAERQRLQGDAIQARYSSLDSARAGLTAGNRLRRQMREPVENLMKATRRLLETTLDDESKKLVDSVLENALLLQTSLQDKESVNAASSEAVSVLPPAASNPSSGAPAGGEPMLAAA